MNKLLRFLYSFFAVAVTALISSYFVQHGMELFYHDLQMPALTPPDRVFPIVWSLLYTLMVISYYIVLNSADTMKVQSASLLFLGQLFLQMIWSFLFFYSAYFSFAGIVILLLVWTVWAMVRKFQTISPAAGYLQIPYLLWTIFAAYLNGGIIYLNGNALNM